jgi:hypothetical protein
VYWPAGQDLQPATMSNHGEIYSTHTKMTHSLVLSSLPHQSVDIWSMYLPAGQEGQSLQGQLQNPVLSIKYVPAQQ